jgi:hypothetical protein
MRPSPEQMRSSPEALPLRLIENARAHASTQPSSQPKTEIDRDYSRTLLAIGGLQARSRIHALHPARPGDEAAANGFAFTLLAHLAALAAQAQRTPRQPRPILWVQDRRARLEAGVPYAHGIGAFGLAATQLVIISTKTALDALAATEIGLETGGLDGVLAELPPNLPADMLALGKRLALRSERSGTPCLLLHASAAPVSAPVATRWQIASQPNPSERDSERVSEHDWGPRIPVVDVVLVKNRFGPTGHWSALLRAPSFSASSTSGVQDVCVSNLSPALPRTVDAVSADRSHQAPRSNAA